MARVTVEDCVELVPNRFELVMMAAQRARDIHGGQERAKRLSDLRRDDVGDALTVKSRPEIESWRLVGMGG